MEKIIMSITKSISISQIKVLFFTLDLKMKNIQKNNRVRLLDKDDDDISDGEIDDDIDMEIATKIKSKYEMLNKDKNSKNKSDLNIFI